MLKLLLSVMEAFSEFERVLIKEKQIEGIVLAKEWGTYKRKEPSLTTEQIQEIKICFDSCDKKSRIACDFDISWETLYQYLKK